MAKRILPQYEVVETPVSTIDVSKLQSAGKYGSIMDIALDMNSKGYLCSSSNDFGDTDAWFFYKGYAHYLSGQRNTDIDSSDAKQSISESNILYCYKMSPKMLEDFVYVPPKRIGKFGAYDVMVEKNFVRVGCQTVAKKDVFSLITALMKELQ